MTSNALISCGLLALSVCPCGLKLLGMGKTTKKLAKAEKPPNAEKSHVTEKPPEASPIAEELRMTGESSETEESPDAAEESPMTGESRRTQESLDALTKEVRNSGSKKPQKHCITCCSNLTALIPRHNNLNTTHKFFHPLPKKIKNNLTKVLQTFLQ